MHAKVKYVKYTATEKSVEKFLTETKKKEILSDDVMTVWLDDAKLIQSITETHTIFT